MSQSWKDVLRASHARWSDPFVPATAEEPSAEPDDFGDPQGEYRALRESWGVADFSRRTQIAATGRDRAIMLHNLCTNEVRKLAPGQGCEAFITSVQGKTLGLVNIYCQPDALILETVPDEAQRLLQHLGKYVVREDVEWTDLNDRWGELLVAGPRAASELRICGAHSIPQRLGEHCPVVWLGETWHLRAVDWAGPGGVLLAGPRHALGAAWQALSVAGALAVGRVALEQARIEQGTPYFGLDVTQSHLPQEVDRDARTISFTKGCYLGQETVARLDALGHVNRTLVGVRFEVSIAARGALPQAGHKLTNQGQPAGEITSSCWSPRLQAPLALAMVRRGFNRPGDRLESAIGAAEVVSLPLA